MTPVNPSLAIAALLAALAFLTHWLVGGRRVVRPLLAVPDLDPASRWLTYLCWHITTVLLLVMALTLALGSVGLVGRDALVVDAVMATSISVLSVVIAVRAGIPPLRFPSTYLLGGVAAAAIVGLVQTT